MAAEMKEEKQTKKYSELRIMLSTDLSELCIKNHWYTRAKCSDYEKLLLMAIGKNLTTANIVAIAENIYEHSENVYFDDICNGLLEICITKGTTRKVR